MGKGIIIKESISIFALEEIKKYVINQYHHLLDHKDDVTILCVDIPFKDFTNIMLMLSENILKNNYYMHFIFENKMYVIYKNTISIINRIDLEAIETSKIIGESFGINRRLLKFEELFRKDHPNG